MEPIPTALIVWLPRPFIGCGLIGWMEKKSERKGEIWQVAPVSIMKGREGLEGEDVMEEEAEKTDEKLEIEG